MDDTSTVALYLSMTREVRWEGTIADLAKTLKVPTATAIKLVEDGDVEIDFTGLTALIEHPWSEVQDEDISISEAEEL